MSGSIKKESDQSLVQYFSDQKNCIESLFSVLDPLLMLIDRDQKIYSVSVRLQQILGYDPLRGSVADLLEDEGEKALFLQLVHDASAVRSKAIEIRASASKISCH